MEPQVKWHDPRQTVSLYGTTPPRADSSEERIALAATRLAERIRRLPVDGLVVYDVQDERERTPDPRPFPFLPTLDPRGYARRLRDLTAMPVIAYKCVAQMPEDAWASWLAETRRDYALDHLVLVGRPTSRGATSGLPLGRVIQLAAAHPGRFTLGGVVIAERHTAARSESERMLQKAGAGCQFFISQAVYDAGPTVRLLADYQRDCRRHGVAPRRVVLTFVPCGRPKTLEFIRWLGVGIADDTARAILADPAPLAKSIQLCCTLLRTILDHDYAETLPLGVNVESVSIYRDEIDASVELVHALQEVLRQYRLLHDGKGGAASHTGGDRIDARAR